VTNLNFLHFRVCFLVHKLYQHHHNSEPLGSAAASAGGCGVGGDGGG
jgi:hypothetical protein